MKFNEWKTRLLAKLIGLQHSSRDQRLQFDVTELINYLYQARRRDMPTILYKLNNIITNYGAKELVELVKQAEEIVKSGE